VISTRRSLGDVAHVSWGDTSTTKSAYTNEGFVAYSASGPDGFLPYADHEAPGVVLSAIGANCGRVWYTPARWSCIKNTIWYRSSDPDVDSQYLFYATSRPSIWPRRGAAQPFISLGDAKSVQVPIPPWESQIRIVAVLSAYDELIENNLRRIEILEEMSQAVYREWFVNFRFPGHDSVALINSSLGPIPDGWKPSTFGDVAENHRATLDPSKVPEEEFAHFSFAAFDDGRAPVIEAGGSMKSGKLMFSEPSVLLAKLNPRIPRVWLAEPDDEHRSLASSEFLVLKARGHIPLHYVYAICTESQFQAELATMSGGTSTSHQRLKLEDLLAHPLAIPEGVLLDAFAQMVAPMNRLAANLVRQNRQLHSTRDLLLSKLVPGEIDVSKLNIDTEWLAS
jgi:type I restriction enzyme S subunit